MVHGTRHTRSLVTVCRSRVCFDLRVSQGGPALLAYIRDQTSPAPFLSSVSFSCRVTRRFSSSTRAGLFETESAVRSRSPRDERRASRWTRATAMRAQSPAAALLSGCACGCALRRPSPRRSELAPLSRIQDARRASRRSLSVFPLFSREVSILTPRPNARWPRLFFLAFKMLRDGRRASPWTSPWALSENRIFMSHAVMISWTHPLLSMVD